MQIIEPQFNYDPNHLFDAIKTRMRLKSDSALGVLLEVSPVVISKIRHRRLPVGATLLIRMHEETYLSIKDLRALMGDRRERFRAFKSASQ